MLSLVAKMPQTLMYQGLKPLLMIFLFSSDAVIIKNLLN